MNDQPIREIATVTAEGAARIEAMIHDMAPDVWAATTSALRVEMAAKILLLFAGFAFGVTIARMWLMEGIERLRCEDFTGLAYSIFGGFGMVIGIVSVASLIFDGEGYIATLWDPRLAAVEHLITLFN